MKRRVKLVKPGNGNGRVERRGHGCNGNIDLRVGSWPYGWRSLMVVARDLLFRFESSWLAMSLSLRELLREPNVMLGAYAQRTTFLILFSAFLAYTSGLYAE